MSFDEIKKELENGELKLYEIEERISDSHTDMSPDLIAKNAAKLRRDFVAEKTGVKIPLVGRSYIDTSDEKGNSATEMVIGGTVTPLSIAGPLKVNGEYADGEFFIPLATNEAALVAGTNRGISAVNKSGGVTTQIKHDHMIRGPLMVAPNMHVSRQLANEVDEKGELFHKMKNYIEDISNVTNLLKIEPITNGREIHFRFYFRTGDSMGMNSATIYATEALKRILMEKHKDCRFKTPSGNTCGDKKSTAINNILGRGKGVETEIWVPSEVLSKVYGLEPRQIEEINYLKNYKGSALAGTLGGFNANAANIVAAMFTATGQDIAQVVESSSAFTNASAEKDGLYFGVTMPSLEVGTVGGGTYYGTAKECLELLGCYGPGKEPGDNAKKFAEIAAGSVTAQELNLLGTLASGTELAESHEKRRRIYVPGNYGDKMETVYVDGVEIPGIDVDGPKPRYGWKIFREVIGMFFELLGSPSGLGGGPQEEKAILDYQRSVEERWKKIDEFYDARKTLRLKK